MSEEEKPKIEEPTPAPKKKKTVDVVPPADFIFDLNKAIHWLQNANERKRGVFTSVRMEQVDLYDDKYRSFLFRLVAVSLRGRYTTGMAKEPGRGTLYIPLEYSKDPELEELERGEDVGKYATFYQPD